MSVVAAGVGGFGCVRGDLWLMEGEMFNALGGFALGLAISITLAVLML